MGRQIHKLSPVTIMRAGVGRHSDGGGLLLQVTAGSDARLSKSWIFRYSVDGKERQMGLGPLELVGLAEARQRAFECRRQRELGIDPLEARSKQKADQEALRAKQKTFAEVCADWLRSSEPGWGNERHRMQVRVSLDRYALPLIGKKLVSDIDTDAIQEVLEQPVANGSTYWLSRNESASRLRGNIESILDRATVKKYRTGENPARWSGHLSALLPSPNDVQQPTNYTALPFTEVPGLLAELRTRQGISARAIEFAILTATRTNDVRQCRWSQINLQERTWVIPRTKNGDRHVVPLSDAALDVLNQVKTDDDVVFPISATTMLKTLVRIRSGCTVHGFRASFKTWADESTHHPNLVVEMCLAHRVGNAVEQAYRRGELLEKRQRVMSDWGNFCCPPSATNVVNLREHQVSG